MVMARVPAAAVAVWGLAQALAQGVSSAWAPFLAQAWATEVVRCLVQARGRASTDCPVGSVDTGPRQSAGYQGHQRTEQGQFS